MAKKKIKTGRKKVVEAEKVILVGFYTKRKYVDAVGGMDSARHIAKNKIEDFAGKIGRNEITMP